MTKKKTAKNYAFIFSGHSYGFHGTSFMRDASSGSSLTLFMFRWALEEIKKDYLNGNKFSILGFDSCMMSMLEVGVELNGVADIIIGSEGDLPNSGWSYAPMLQQFIPNFHQKIELSLNQSAAAADQSENQKRASIDLLNYRESERYKIDVAKEFVNEFVHRYDKLGIGGRSIDLAAWNLNNIGELARKVNDLGAAFHKHLFLADKMDSDQLTNDEISVFQDLKKIILQAHYDAQTFMREQSVDIRDFCRRLVIEFKYMENSPHSKIWEDLKNICLDIIDETKKCVLRSGFSGDEFQFADGIALYFPWSLLAFELTQYRYQYLHFVRGVENYDTDNPKGIGSDWYKFLQHYLSCVTLRLTRKLVDEKGKDCINELENFDKNSKVWKKAIWDKDNPFWTSPKDAISGDANAVYRTGNPAASKSNPTASKSNPTASKSNPTASKSNPTATKGEVGEYYFYFSRFKNYQLRWDISGCSEDFKFERDFDDK
ncbi:MAG: clostripain-related cysteine peptidase [Pyrinomonadaceae bacterium]